VELPTVAIGEAIEVIGADTRSAGASTRTRPLLVTMANAQPGREGNGSEGEEDEEEDSVVIALGGRSVSSATTLFLCPAARGELFA